MQDFKERRRLNNNLLIAFQFLVDFICTLKYVTLMMPAQQFVLNAARQFFLLYLLVMHLSKELGLLFDSVDQETDV